MILKLIWGAKGEQVGNTKKMEINGLTSFGECLTKFVFNMEGNLLLFVDGV